MTSTKFIHLLRLLSPVEFKKFGQFLRSPFLNNNKKIILLYDWLAKYFPRLDHSKLSKELTFSIVFPKGKKYDVRQLRNLLSEGSKALYLFLAMLEVKNEERVKNKLVLRSLQRKKQYLKFEQHTELLRTKLEENPIRDMNYYLENFQLESSFYLHPQTEKLRPEVDSLGTTINHLDRFYVMAKLRFASEMLYREKILADNYEIHLLDDTMELASSFAVENPVFKIYQDILNLQKEGHEEVTFKRLKNNFETYHHLLCAAEKTEILPFLLNHANQVQNTAQQNYLDIQYDLYSFGLDHDLWMLDGQFPPMIFYNIITLGLILNKIKWTDEFLNTYKGFLAPENRKELVAIGEAKILFTQKEFWVAEKKLSLVESTSPIFELINRRLSTRCWFEIFLLEENIFDLMFSKLENFGRYLSRNKYFSVHKLEKDKKYCRVLKKMASTKNLPKDQKKMVKAKIKKELEQEKLINNRTWLLEKIELL